jgi:choline kinase
MKCIILAAGSATRMRPLTDTLPKCLLPVGGKPILQRTIEYAAEAGIEYMGIVVGYYAEAVRRFVKEQFPLLRIRFVVNPKYESTNNAFSLLMAREFFNDRGRGAGASEDLLLLDADLVFSPRLLPYLLSKVPANRIAVRVAGPHDEEEVRVNIDAAGNIAAIGKSIPLAETYGESIGVELFSHAAADSLFETLERRVRSGEGRTEFYEASFQSMIAQGTRFEAVDVSAFPAVEVDTPEDLRAAETLAARFDDAHADA